MSQTFENPAIQMAGMVVGAIAMGYGAAGVFGTETIGAVMASGASTSFTTTYITTGDFGDSMQAGVLGGLSAGVTYGVAHGAAGGTSPFGAALPVAHGVVQGGFHELQGGSFNQGFISGVIGKLGGGIVHDGDKTLTLQEAGGMVIVSGIAAAASGANSRDAVMRSAMSVITIYLYNDLSGMNGIAKMSEAKSIMQDADDVATVQTIEFFKKEGPALAVDSLTVTVGSIDCVAGSKIGCAPALWAAASIDARFNQQSHIVEQGLMQLNIPYAPEITNLIGLGLSAQGTVNFMQGYTTLDNTIDAVGTGVLIYEGSNKP